MMNSSSVVEQQNIQVSKKNGGTHLRMCAGCACINHGAGTV